MDRVQRAERRTVFFCVLALILLNLVVYGLWITKLGVYEDDWKLVVMPSTSLERLLANWWSFLRIERPLDGLNLAILSITLRVAGLLAVRVILLLPHLIACIVLFFLLQRMVGNQPWLSFLGAALFAVYPTDLVDGIQLLHGYALYRDRLVGVCQKYTGRGTQPDRTCRDLAGMLPDQYIVDGN